ncbi:MAG: hypothetical protein ACOYMV_06995 [Verrucomicrobiia bacterium]
MVSTLKIFEILEAARVEDRTARAITQAIERAMDDNNTEQARILATKTDLAEAKAEIIRWMFLFWLGLIPIIAGLIRFIR